MEQRPLNPPASSPPEGGDETPGGPASPRQPHASTSADIDALKLLHELQVHQVELAQQNEELEVARSDLEASSQRYFDLYESAPVGLLTMNRDGIVRDANRRARQLMDDDDLVGRRWTDYLVAGSRGELAKALAAPETEREAGGIEVCVAPTTTGMRILRVEIRPQPFGDDSVLLALDDITEQRRSEADLAHTRELLELSNRVARIGHWQADLEAKVLNLSAVALEICGFAPDHAPNLTEILELCKENTSRERLRAARAAAVQQGTTFDIELPIATPAGRCRWIRVTGKVEPPGNGTRRFYGTVQDIDPYVQAAAARLAQAEAEMATRSKNAFLARMSHDLRTPLNAVLGFSELLLRNGEVMALPGVATQVRHILESGEHLLAMIDDVLDLARIESGDIPISIEPVDLEPLLATCATLVAPLAAAHQLTLRSPASGARHCVLGDRTRLQQVLTNLLGNAIKYNRPGGSVDLEVHDEEDGIAIEIRDTGEGLSAEQVPHLFEPFNRLGAEHRGIEGTGLGLVIAKQLIESMAGTISVQSTPGSGSVFCLHLQRSTDRVVQPPPTASAFDATSASADERSFTVLYVEDNPVNIELMRAVLTQRREVRLEVARDGDVGLEMARRLRPDLVLLDMGLPTMNGLAVQAQLRADPDLALIPCVAVSANAMESDIRRALDAGFTDYIVKPFTLSRLLELLDSVRESAKARRRDAGGAPLSLRHAT